MQNAVYLMNRGGVGFLRKGVLWNQYEPSAGNKTMPSIKKSLIELLENYGMEQLNITSFGNKAYQPEIPAITYMPETEEAIEAFAEYAGDMAKYNMKYHEIWNEANTTGFNSGNTGWDIYTEILKKSYQKIKAADPKAHVSAGSIVSIPDVPYNALAAIFDNGGGDYMDSLCIHPYIWDASPSQTNFHGKLEKLRNWLDDRGYPDVAVWVTEMGWGAGPAQAFTFDEQAAYLSQSYIIFKAVNPTGKFVWYDGVQDGLSETNREHNFGIINSWGAGEKATHPRKAFVALANMNDLMVGSEFVDYENLENKGYYYHFKTRDGEDMYAVFSSEKSYSMGFFRREYVRAIDLYGNESKIYAVDGVVNVTATEETVYLIGSSLQSCTPNVYPDKNELKMVYGEKSDINITAPENAAVTYSTVADGLTLECDDKKATVDMTEQKNDKDEINFKVVSDDKTILTGCVTLNYVDVVEVSVLNVPYSTENYNRWVGTLVVKNNSEINSISGKMIFDEPELFAKKLHLVEIPEIKPQETKQVKFHLPDILKKEVYNLSARVVLDNGYVKSFADRIDFVVATYADNIKIDGVMEDDEWTWGTALAFNNPKEYYTFSGYSFNGTDDLSGKAVVAYDEENIYLGVKVTDDVFYCQETTNGIWADDSIQCALAYAKLNGDPDSTQRTEFGMALTPEGEKLFTYSVEDVSLNLGEIKVKEVGGDIAIKREGNTTTYELKMPLTQVFQRNAKVGPGYRVAFSLLINDNDGNGRKGGAEIASGIIGQKYIELFTYLQFMGK